MSEYDPQKDGLESYNVWVASQRAKLLQERCPAAKRVEVIGDAELYLGDCAYVIPTLDPVHAVITDPPYGIDYGKAGGFSKSSGWKDWRGKAEWDECRPAQGIFDAILGVSKEQIIWGGNYFTDYLPPTMRWLVWDKGQRNFTLADCEFAWTSQNKAARIFTYARGKAAQDGKEHPTQKPIELMKWCLEFLPKAQVILDPFMGSGTTGIACANVGRRFIGIEREESYFDIACERIRKAYAQPDMFVCASKTEEPKQEAFL